MGYAGSYPSSVRAFSLDFGIGLVNRSAATVPMKKRASQIGMRLGSGGIQQVGERLKELLADHLRKAEPTLVTAMFRGAF